MKLFLTVVISLMMGASIYAQEMPAKEVDQDAMMKAYMEMIALTDEHKNMGEMVGTYKSVQKFWMTPGGEAMKSEGKMTTKALMDGRYFQSDYEGNSMGAPFYGMSLAAYDKAKKKYVTTWIDNMGTGIMMFEGTMVDDKLIQYAKYLNPMTGKMEKHKMVIYPTDKGHNMEYYTPSMTDGQIYKSMEIEYTKM